MSLKEPTPSIASDISLPIATQELRQRLRQLEKYVVSTMLLATPGTGSWWARGPLTPQKAHRALDILSEIVCFCHLIILG